MADDRVLPAIEFIQEHIDRLLTQVAEQKDLANKLASAAGLEPIYSEIERPGESKSGSVAKILPDQFANYTAPSAAARAYLETRSRLPNRTATLDVIFDALEQGGFAFASNTADAKNGLKISLGKDYQVRKLPNDQYGLTEWYPNVTIKRERAKKVGEPSGSKASDTKTNGEIPLGLKEIQEELPGLDSDEDELE